MDRIEKLRELFDKVSTLQAEKLIIIQEQRYVEAAELRDKERKLIDEIDELVGHVGYYNETINMEEIIFHLNSVEESLNKLEKLGVVMGDKFNIEIDSKSLLELQQKRMKIQNDLLNFNVNLELPEKIFKKS